MQKQLRFKSIHSVQWSIIRNNVILVGMDGLYTLDCVVTHTNCLKISWEGGGGQQKCIQIKAKTNAQNSFSKPSTSVFDCCSGLAMKLLIILIIVAVAVGGMINCIVFWNSHTQKNGQQQLDGKMPSDHQVEMHIEQRKKFGFLFLLNTFAGEQLVELIKVVGQELSVQSLVMWMMKQPLHFSSNSKMAMSSAFYSLILQFGWFFVCCVCVCV